MQEKDEWKKKSLKRHSTPKNLLLISPKQIIILVVSKEVTVNLENCHSDFRFLTLLVPL